MSKSTRWQVTFFLSIKIRSGFLAWIGWSICISKSQRTLCNSFLRTDSGLCISHLLAEWNFNPLHYSEWITFPTPLAILLYSFMCLFAIFIYYVINCFISYYNLTYTCFLQHILNFCFDLIGSYDTILSYF